MTWTDRILLLSTLLFFWRGWSKGLLQSILGPILLIVCTWASFCYFEHTHDILIAAAIGLFAPILFNFVAKIVIRLLFPSDDKKKIFLPSRVAAGFLNVIWGEFILIITIFTLLLIPLEFPALKNIQNDILSSSTYIFLKPKIDERFQSHNIQSIHPENISNLSNPEKLKELADHPEFQTLLNDERVQDILQDSIIQEQIKNKQLSELMKNPKILKLTSDPALMKKFLTIYAELLK